MHATDTTLPLAGGPGSLELTVPAEVGRFTILGMLGSGGMGVVLLGQDPQLGRKVAIKLVRPEVWAHAGARAQERLRSEAQAMAKVAHENVISVFEVGEAAGQFFIVLEYVEGVTLASWLRRQQRSVAEIVRVFVAAGRGLQAAHEAGLVHRDFKPSNVLIGPDGRPRIGDFGLVLGVEPEAMSTPPSMALSSPVPSGIAGTPGYMPPEQFRLEELDARADQFAFCVSLHEAIHGERPFVGRTFAPHAARRTSRKQARATARIDAILARGLELERANRWRSMAALVAELERVGTAGRRRRRALAGMVALAAAMAVAAAAWLARPALPVAPPRAIGLEQRQLTFGGRVQGMELSPDGTTLAYHIGDELVLLDIDSGHEQRVPLAGGAQLYQWRGDSSAVEVNALTTSNGDVEPMLVSRTGVTSRPPAPYRFGVGAPDGSGFARGSAADHLVLLERPGQPARRLPVGGSDDTVWVQDWSSDGRFLVVSTSDAEQRRTTLWSVPVDGQPPRRLVDERDVDPPRGGMTARLTPGDRGVIYLRPHENYERELVLVPLADGKPSGAARVLVSGWRGQRFGMSRDGRVAIFLKGTPSPVLWLGEVDHPDAEQPEVRWRQLLADTAGKLQPRFAPDGRSLLYTTTDDGNGAGVFVVGLDGGPPRRIGPRSIRDPSAAWAPDSRAVAILDRGEESLWIVSLVDGSQRRVGGRLRGELDIEWAPAPEIARLSPGRRNFLLVDPRTGASRRWLPEDSEGRFYAMWWAPNARDAATYWYTADGRPSGRELRLVSPGQPDRTLAHARLDPAGWSSDGQWVYGLNGLDEVVRVLATGGPVLPWVKAPSAHDWRGCQVSPDSRHVACLGEPRADVWLVEHFDRLLR